MLITELGGEPLLHHFKISNYGNVVRIKKGEGPEEPFDPKEIGGYKYISFTTRNKKRETIYIHRLIAEFFIRKPKEDATYVIHKDYDRRNNNYQNLKWVDQKTLYKHRAQKAGRTPGKSSYHKKMLQTDVAAYESEVSNRSLRSRVMARHLGVNQ